MSRELVDALISGNSVAIDNEFNRAISAKVSDMLDGYRVAVAKSIFNTPDDSNIDLGDD